MIIDIALYIIGGRGGVEEAVKKVYKGMVKKGHRVRIFIKDKPVYKEDFLLNFSEVYIYGEKDKDKLEDCVEKYSSIIKKIGLPDVTIAAHLPLQSYICYNALVKNSDEIPLVISWIHSPLFIFESRESLKLCKGHLAISSYIANQIKEIVGDSDIEIIGNPIDINNVNEIIRPKDKFKILSIGRIHVAKNINLLLRGLSKINMDYELTIIGEGEIRKALIVLAKILKINDKIKWLGWVDDPWNQIDEASLLISTSNYEGFGLVIAEALARGVPVISTDSGGPKDIINDSNGWIIEKKDEEKLADIISKLCKKELQLPSKEDCKKSVEKYDSNKVIDKIENFILKFVKK